MIQATPIKDEIFQRLDLLAAKLGVASAHLWEVLTRQGFVEGIFGIGSCILGLLVIILGLYFLHKVSKLDGSGNTDPEEAFGLVLSIIVCILGAVVIYVKHSDIKYLLNPEYFALTEILQLFN